MKKISTKALTFARRLAIVMLIVFIGGKVYLSSCEANTNMKIKKLQDSITAIDSRIDALEMEKQELVSFARIQEVATANGLQYEQSAVVATIVDDNNE